MWWRRKWDGVTRKGSWVWRRERGGGIACRTMSMVAARLDE